MDFFSLIQALRDRKHRLTSARKAILAILCDSGKPLSAPEILRRLSKRKIEVDRTTVYREIAFLKDLGILSEIQLGEAGKRFEILLGDHHHHLVCVRCRQVDDVVLENDLDAAERKIARMKRFKVMRHSLEFFGLCSKCR